MDTQHAATPVNQTAGKEKKQGRRKKRILRKLMVLLLVLALLGALGYGLYLKLKQEYTITYQSYTASLGTISNSLSFSGTLQAIDNTSYTASSSTSVRALYVSKGDLVQEGQRLMRLANGTIIEAGFAGRVNQLPVAVGDEVASGDTLIQVVDFEHLKVSFRVDEYDISDVQEGDQVTVTTTATESTFNATIDDINYVSSSTGSVAYYTATAYVDVSGGVYPGMQVTVTIPQEEASNVVILKEEAISFDATNQAFVYTRQDDGAMEQTYIKTGVSNGKYVEITEGVNSGDTVYAVVENTAASVGSSLLSSIFGGQQMMGPPAGGNGGFDPANMNFEGFEPSNGERPGRGSGGFGGGQQ